MTTIRGTRRDRSPRAGMPSVAGPPATPTPSGDAEGRTGRQKPVTEAALLFTEVSTERGHGGVGSGCSKRGDGSGRSAHADADAPANADAPVDAGRRWDRPTAQRTDRCTEESGALPGEELPGGVNEYRSAHRLCPEPLFDGHHPQARTGRAPVPTGSGSGSGSGPGLTRGDRAGARAVAPHEAGSLT